MHCKHREAEEKGAQKETDLGVLGITLCFLRQGINQSLLIPRQKAPLVITISILSGSDFTLPANLLQKLIMTLISKFQDSFGGFQEQIIWPMHYTDRPKILLDISKAVLV